MKIHVTDGYEACATCTHKPKARQIMDIKTAAEILYGSNRPRINEYVGNCGGSGNPYVLEVVTDDCVWVKIDSLEPMRCIVARDSNNILQAVRIAR